MSSASEPQDGCPPWASALILQLRDLEIKLGNLHPPGDWREAKVREFLDRLYVDDQGSHFDESVVEAIFRKLSRGLMDEGYTAEQIASFINGRLKGESRLPYCSGAEVIEAATQSP